MGTRTSFFAPVLAEKLGTRFTATQWCNLGEAVEQQAGLEVGLPGWNVVDRGRNPSRRSVALWPVLSFAQSDVQRLCKQRREQLQATEN